MRAFAALHRLAPSHRATTPEGVARSLVALHSTDPASVPLAVAARTTGAGLPPAALDRALYDDRSLVRVMGMRRTIWVVPVELVPVVAGACGQAIAADERRKLVKALEDSGVARDGARWLADIEVEVLDAIAARGAALTTEITTDVPLLKGTVRVGGTSKWATDVGIGTRVVLVLGCEGRIVRERPRGSWASSQYRWSVAPPVDPLPTADAQAELARRWLGAFGADSIDPAADLKWWAGWTVGATKRALAAAGDVEPGDPPVPEPWAALLPSLDPTTMGWKQRDWYLGDLGPQIFDRNGNAGATVWWDGRIVGGWAQRASGEVVTRLLVDIGRAGAAAVEAETARLQAWLDDAGGVPKPRFPGPMQKELCA